MSEADWWIRLQGLIGRESKPVHAWDAVNVPMIRHWCEATGNTNPLYADRVFTESRGPGDVVAPPSMLHAWLLPGLRGERAPGSAEQDAGDQMLALLAEGGYTMNVAVNSEQEYLRYLRSGDRLSATTTLESISSLKDTALGSGYFATLLIRYFDQHEQEVAQMRFRQFVYRPESSQ